MSARQTPRQRLAALLSKQAGEHFGVALTFTPDRVLSAEGWYRSNPFSDTLRWEASAPSPRVGSQMRYRVGSYDTMTKCLRYGFRLVPSGKSWEAEVYANDEEGKR